MLEKKVHNRSHALLKKEEVWSFCSVSKCTTVLQPAAALQLAIALFHNVCVGGCVFACMLGKL